MEVITREMVDAIKEVLRPNTWRLLPNSTKRMLCETLSGEITKKAVDKALRQIKRSNSENNRNGDGLPFTE